MQDPTLTREISIAERAPLDELEPIVLATVSEATGTSSSGSGDPLDTVVWGMN